MKVPFRGLLLAGSMALAVAACGGTSQHTSSTHESAALVWHRLVQCARQHGMPDLPDPTVDDQGQAHFPDGTPKPPPSVQQACQAIYDQLPAQVRETTSGPDPALMRQFAQCMRAHGIDDWPDPDAQGNFHMPPSLNNVKLGPRAPQIMAAWRGPCAKYDPSGHIYTAP